jgi:hypothetical protein
MQSWMLLADHQIGGIYSDRPQWSYCLGTQTVPASGKFRRMGEVKGGGVFMRGGGRQGKKGGEGIYERGFRREEETGRSTKGDRREGTGGG